MANDGAILVWKITLWAAPIIGGAIALFANYKIDRIQTSQNLKNMQEKNKIGDTYNTRSYNQSGGITAGKLEINVPKEEQVNELSIPLNDNYQIDFDKNKKLFTCQPKVGKWEKPFIAIPFEEKLSYKGFGGKEQLTDVQEGLDFTIEGAKFFGCSSGVVANNAKPATRQFFYYMEFKSLPSFILFGDYQKVAYKINLQNGNVSLY